jgi:NAD(P)H dehydrogenase (quinone)
MYAMKHAIILAHPQADSFNASVADAYKRAATGLGHEVVVRDLYRLDFDPRLQASERPDASEFKPGADVERERDILRGADVFAFVYPLWFNAPPAILKGYLDRVFSAGFGYRELRNGGECPLLVGKKMISFTSSGSTKARLEEQGAWLSICQLFDQHFARMCGLELVDHVHFPSVVAGLAKRWIDENLWLTENKVRQHFAAPPNAQETGCAGGVRPSA